MFAHKLETIFLLSALLLSFLHFCLSVLGILFLRTSSVHSEIIHQKLYLNGDSRSQPHDEAMSPWQLFLSNQYFMALPLALIGITLLFSLISRGFYVGRFPCSNLYESLIFFACALAFVATFIQFKYKLSSLNWPACLIVMAMLVYAVWLPSSQKEATPLLPALDSYWRAIHVPALLLSYTFLLVSGFCSGFYLFRFYSKAHSIKDNQKENQLGFLSELVYRCTSAGFALLTFGIVTGALWANHSWGNLWQWDPKENLALMTWFCYGAYLHLRLSNKVNGVTLAWLNALGVLAIYMTYIGINQFDLGGLHTYGKV